MSKAMQLVGIILLGIITLVIIYLMSDARSTNELDYYLLQEVTESSMYDAVDYSYYRETGLLKVDRDMFLESFNRRFAESVQANREYEIKIIDFNETPPKVSVEVTAPTVASVKGEVALITNRVSGIIETIYDDFVYSRGDYKSNNVDESSPVIVFMENNTNNNNYRIIINDDLYIDGYKVIKMDNNNKNKADTICSSIKDWDSPGRWVTNFAFEQTLDNNNTGYWIAAKDGVGNCTVKPLSDINPWINNLTYDATPSDTGLIAYLFDDHGLSKYYIAPSSWTTSNLVSNCSNNSSKCKVVDISKNTDFDLKTGNYKYILNIELKKIFDNSNHGTYSLFVVDNKGHITKSNEVLHYRQSHLPKVEYAYNPTSNTAGTLTLTISDPGNDLAGYYYSTQNYAPVDNYTTVNVTNNQSVNINVNLSEKTLNQNYYIWVKDEQNDVRKLTINVAHSDITQTPSCASGGTYNKSTGKCDYNECKYSVENKCKTTITVEDRDNCLEERISCQKYKNCTIVSLDCVINGSNTGHQVCHSSDNNCIDNFRNGCRNSSGNKCDSCVKYNNFSGRYELCGKETVYNDNCKSNYISGTKNETCIKYGTKTECIPGFDEVTSPCSKDPSYTYTCKDGYTNINNNNKACVKITASE